MVDTSTSLSTYVPIQRVNTTSTQTSAATTTQDGTFQQLLMTSMLSSMTSSGEDGMDTSMLLLPLMLSLIEQLVEQNVEQEDTNRTFNETASSAALTSLNRSTSRSQPSGRPVEGRLTQAYHTGHYGLDFGIAVGTPVKATMDGKVVYAGWNNEGYGNLVIVENGAYRTYYAHLSEIPVQVGDQVSSGSTIGLSGNTGNSTGPHLHYEVRYQNRCIDPTSYTLV